MSKKKPETDPADASASGGGADLPPFEQAVDEVQRIIDEVESGEVPLADSLDRYSRGMKLLRHCRSILDEAEKKIRTLTAEGETADDGGE